MSNPKIIAFYLPQYHPTPDNDKWWGKGFTEWTNVGKAKSYFPGHYQPKVPADLGYYDLRLPEVREAQAELAKEAGIYGFCYYHYWFGNGQEELELPLNEVLRLGKPNFPFMLCWANESWHKKFWDSDGKGSSKQLLIEQTYPGEQDIIDHFYRVLPALKDPRYIRIDGKPAFMIYKYAEHPDIKHFISKWNELALSNGLGGIHFIAQINFDLTSDHVNHITGLGFDAVNTMGLTKCLYNDERKWSLRHLYSIIKRRILKTPLIKNYRKIYLKLFSSVDSNNNVYPTMIPNWDHTPRSKQNGCVVVGSNPDLFKEHASHIINIVDKKATDNKIIFLKSWNEWGEGNYMEPDLKYHKGYINALHDALELNKVSSHI